MTDKKKVVKKATTKKKTAGAPTKYDKLLLPNNFQKIVEMTRRGMPRDVVALMMDVNYDTLLKALKAKGFLNFKDFAQKQELIFRDMVKVKYYDHLMSDNATEKIIIDSMNRVEKKEECEKEEVEVDKPKVIIMSNSEDMTDDEIVEETMSQQDDLMERIKQHRLQNGLGEE